MILQALQDPAQVTFVVMGTYTLRDYVMRMVADLFQEPFKLRWTEKYRFEHPDGRQVIFTADSSDPTRGYPDVACYVDHSVTPKGQWG
jgi:hypothetical protein